MTSDELVEKVARGLMHSEKWSSFFGYEDAEAFARAAIRIALEEASKVADEFAQSSDAKFNGVLDKARDGSKNLELAGATAIGMSHITRTVAGRIRSLIHGE